MLTPSSSSTTGSYPNIATLLTCLTALVIAAAICLTLAVCLSSSVGGAAFLKLGGMTGAALRKNEILKICMWQRSFWAQERLESGNTLILVWILRILQRRYRKNNLLPLKFLRVTIINWVFIIYYIFYFYAIKLIFYLSIIKWKEFPINFVFSPFLFLSKEMPQIWFSEFLLNQF